MDRVEIPCPQCGKLLAIPDRNLLGRKGKCPRCQHRFLLSAPADAIQFQEATGSEGDGAETVALSAQATPEVPPPVSLPGKSSVNPSVPKQGTAAVTPATAARPPVAIPAKTRTVSTTDPLSSPVTAPVMSSGSASVTPAGSDPLADGGFVTDSEAPVATPPTRPMAARRRRSGGGRPLVWLGTAALILAVGGFGAWWASQKSTTQGKKRARPAVAARGENEKNGSGDAEEGGSVTGEPASPTQGPPLKLRYVPLGTRMVIHLRPSELWADTDAADEFRACLGPLVPAVEQRLGELALFPAAQLESVLLAFIPKSRDAFEIAVVARTVSDFKRSEVLEKINGELVNSPRPHFVGPARVFLVPDNRTVASAPKEMAETFLEAADRPLDASEGLETVLSRTDALHQLTVVAEVEDLRNGVDTLVPERARKLLTGVVDFLGDNVETVGWSFHLGGKGDETRFFNEFVVRNQTTRSAGNLARDLKKKVESWPREMLDLVEKIRPETQGHGKVVGRFPAMTQVVSESLWESHTQRLVTFRADLPSLAAPNLAAGALLTWDYASRPGFGTGPAGSPGAPGAGKNLTIAERLRKPISVDFRNEFLFKALEFIEGEIGVKIKTDGPGMQRVGVTQNMRQDLKFENTPASEILFVMLDKNLKERELCLWIDEANGQAVVTSRVVAEEQKRPIFPLQGK